MVKKFKPPRTKITDKTSEGMLHQRDNDDEMASSSSEHQNGTDLNNDNNQARRSNRRSTRKAASGSSRGNNNNNSSSIAKNATGATTNGNSDAEDNEPGNDSSEQQQSASSSTLSKTRPTRSKTFTLKKKPSTAAATADDKQSAASSSKASSSQNQNKRKASIASKPQKKPPMNLGSSMKAFSLSSLSSSNKAPTNSATQNFAIQSLLQRTRKAQATGTDAASNGNKKTSGGFFSISRASSDGASSSKGGGKNQKPPFLSGNKPKTGNSSISFLSKRPNPPANNAANPLHSLLSGAPKAKPASNVNYGSSSSSLTAMLQRQRQQKQKPQSNAHTSHLPKPSSAFSKSTNDSSSAAAPATSDNASAPKNTTSSSIHTHNASSVDDLIVPTPITPITPLSPGGHSKEQPITASASLSAALGDRTSSKNVNSSFLVSPVFDMGEGRSRTLSLNTPIPASEHQQLNLSATPSTSTQGLHNKQQSAEKTSSTALLPQKETSTGPSQGPKRIDARNTSTNLESKKRGTIRFGAPSSSFSLQKKSTSILPNRPAHHYSSLHSGGTKRFSSRPPLPMGSRQFASITHLRVTLEPEDRTLPVYAPQGVRCNYDRSYVITLPILPSFYPYNHKLPIERFCKQRCITLHDSSLVDSDHCFLMIRFTKDEFQIQKDDGEWIKLKQVYKITDSDKRFWREKKDRLLNERGLAVELKRGDRIFVPSVTSANKHGSSNHRAFYKFILTKFSRKYNVDLSKKVVVRYRDGLIQILNRRNYWVTRATYEHVDRATFLRMLNSLDGFDEEIKRKENHVYIIIPANVIAGRKTAVQLNLSAFGARHNVDLQQRTLWMRLRDHFLLEIRNKNDEWVPFFDFKNGNVQQCFQKYGECLICTPYKKGLKPIPRPPIPQFQKKTAPAPAAAVGVGKKKPAAQIYINPQLWEETNRMAQEIVQQLYSQQPPAAGIGFPPMTPSASGKAGMMPGVAAKGPPQQQQQQQQHSILSTGTPVPSQQPSHQQQQQQQYGMHPTFQHPGGAVSVPTPGAPNAPGAGTIFYQQNQQPSATTPAVTPSEYYPPHNPQNTSMYYEDQFHTSADHSNLMNMTDFDHHDWHTAWDPEDHTGVVVGASGTHGGTTASKTPQGQRPQVGTKRKNTDQHGQFGSKRPRRDIEDDYQAAFQFGEEDEFEGV